MTGLLAGLLVALAPLLVWYSQELRMFQPAATGLVWSAYFLLARLAERRLAGAIGLVAGFVLAMDSGALQLSLCCVHAARRRADARLRCVLLDRRTDGGVAHAALYGGCDGRGRGGLLFLPLARNAWLVNEAESTPGRAFQDFVANTEQLLRNFTVWRVDWPDEFKAAVICFLALLCLSASLCLVVPRRA